MLGAVYSVSILLISENLLNDLSAFSLTLRPYVHLIGEPHFPIFDWQDTITGSILRIELTPAAAGVQVDVLVHCETADSYYDFFRSEELSEPDLARFLAECFGLLRGLVPVIEQNR